MMRIDWTPRSLPEWESYFTQIDKTNLIQTYAYARTARAVSYQTTRFGVIFCDDTVTGLVQVQEIRLLGGLIHFVFLDRGPLWKKGADTLANQRKFFDLFNRQFPRRILRRRRILPEMPDTPDHQKIMTDCGYKKTGVGYHSAWLDISRDESEIRAGLKQKWRNSLNKAEKEARVQVVADKNALDLPWFLSVCAQDKKQRGYGGASFAFMGHLATEMLAGKNLLFLKAVCGMETVAGVLILLHGNSATYQLGWTSPVGRQQNAHHLLLWESIKVLKNKDIKWLDLGGMNTETAGGVTAFKRGLGGQDYHLCGIYT